MSKRYAKKGRSRFKAQGRRSRWRSERIKLKRAWSGKEEHSEPLIARVTGIDLDNYASYLGATRKLGETDAELRARLREEVW